MLNHCCFSGPAKEHLIKALEDIPRCDANEIKKCILEMFLEFHCICLEQPSARSKVLILLRTSGYLTKEYTEQRELNIDYILRETKVKLVDVIPVKVHRS
ncbi:hypothetical protein L2E82_02903 [Cichorium intybus]|uniref:Uncharacterized protein n=1 Tax=Cichorium intybus TaxID=13427 RepID=A0ACB9H415_CICIN|nr:hypothetical protein L2E82_02903 [Cichorium intybus]